MVCLLLCLSYLAGLKSVSARLSVGLSDLDTMAIAALEAIASSSGKNQMVDVDHVTKTRMRTNTGLAKGSVPAPS